MGETPAAMKRRPLGARETGTVPPITGLEPMDPRWATNPSATTGARTVPEVEYGHEALSGTPADGAGSHSAGELVRASRSAFRRSAHRRSWAKVYAPLPGYQRHNCRWLGVQSFPHPWQMNVMAPVPRRVGAQAAPRLPRPESPPPRA